MKTKPFVLFSVLAVLAMLMASCAPAATPVAPTTAPVAQPTTPPATAVPTTAAPTTAAATQAPTAAQSAGSCPLQVEQGAHIVFSGWSSSTAEDTVDKDAVARFEAVCPGVTVDYQPIPTDFQTKIKAEMAGGTAPDVFYLDYNLMTALAPNGQLLALNDYMSQAGVKLSDFVPALTGEFVDNNTVYGLPKDWSTLGLVYLPEAFTAAGIPEPTNDWTYTDLINAAKTIASKTKYAGFCMAADAVRLWPWVASMGGDYTTPDYKTATLNTKPVEDAATMVENMKKDGSLKTPTDLSVSWCGEALGKQVAAMTLEGTWMISYMQQTYPDVKYNAVLPPSGSVTRADMTFTNALAVNASTKYPKAAAAFVLYFTGEANTLDIQNTGFAFSPHPNDIPKNSDPIAKAMLPGGQLPATKPEFWGPYTGKLESVVSNALDRVFLGQQTVTQSFDQAQQEATSALAGQ
jgi:multiple sugar transport system substrate-binding protein